MSQLSNITQATAIDVDAAIQRMAEQIHAECGADKLALVGIRRGGIHVAELLKTALESLSQSTIPLGTVDIALYRDDGFNPNDWPDVGVTDLPFEMRQHTVHLVDDVLFTGRTVRSALEAILDYGRPRGVKLAVLVDRGWRELPIQADVCGITLETGREQHVDVQLQAAGYNKDKIVIEAQPSGVQ